MKKRVLIISYYRPPAGGISPHRCLKFAKYLPQYGWEPVVATVENPTYFFYDVSSFKDISHDLEVIKTKIWEPHNLFKVFAGIKNKDRFPDVFVEENKTNLITKIGIWIRGNLFIPDARMFWINAAVKQIEKYLKQHPVDVVFSNGPPHSAHMIAYKLKKKLDIPWLADFQDPWTQADYFQKLMLNPVSKKIHQAKEQLIFKNADKITICSDSWKNDLEAIGAHDVGVIYWGFDDDDFKFGVSNNANKFSIGHFGRLTPDRNPLTLWKVLADISAEKNDFAHDLEIELAGFNSHSILESIQNFGLRDNLRIVEHVTRKEALIKMKNSSVLLLILNEAENVNGRIPGKLFEYMAVKRPVLIIGPEESDAAKIAVQTETGTICAFDDYIKTRSVILNLYAQFKKYKLQDIQSTINSFTNKKTTGELVKYLNQITRNE
jgi:glycosyltransferase involved in cell wall biosynthesis